MNFFTALGLSLACLTTFNVAALAQESAPATPSGTQQAKAQNGIRFITKKPGMTIESEVYMPTEKGKIEKVQINKGLPGARVFFPKGMKVISLYTGVDDKGKPTGLLIQKELPANISNRTLAIVDKLANGKWDIMFINEAEIPYGAVNFYNLTNKTFVIKLTNPPTGEQPQIILPSLGTYVFGKSNKLESSSTTTPAVLMDEKKLPNGKKQWFKERGFMITTYKQRKVIMLITPDPSGRTVELSEIMLFMESSTSGAANKEK